ncbi:hypothetical protein CXB51_029709 [Gossypium anomalum]|uniref:ADP-ribosyl cyclase/cyclic ADP-ribose hydrolase n=1 Tax=Gossypium anomalum TaxID=47600 RepID=A0A8J5YFZ1_9ROSI|nr:hypothetical protein CXB51_029709 [Gossypium anomalum]
MLASTSSSSAAMIEATAYDVFVSFRGEDTRNGFVSHLYKDLCRKKIQVFIDDEGLRRGDEISGALLTAIEGSRVSVIVFSKNYASSRWCLDELVKIMDCKKLKQHYLVVPVFYGVDPSDVRKQKGNFGDAIAKHEENLKHDVEKVKSWRSALTSAANLSGWDSHVTRPDSTLVDKIVKDVLKKLNRGTSSANLEGLVGVERRMQKVLSLFQYGFPEFQILGIWGMGGTGKTTLAQAIFYHVLDGFQSYFFLANVRESADQGKLFQLRQKLFSTILEYENLDISTPTIIPSFVKDRLSRKKVLVVCDDVSKSSQLEYLFGGNNRLGPGSRVIVTTRDKQVLIQYGVDLIYKVEELDRDESVQLFCQCAFKSNHPTEYQLELSEMVLSFANGNPLAIKIFGSSLHGKDKNYQESAVKELKQIPNPDILKLLRSSFDGLNPVEKDIFLDIACFLKGENLDFVRRIVDACYGSAHSSIENLIDKSLISVSQHEIAMHHSQYTIAMHDLLQQIGRDIIYNESPSEPERRSRLWIPNDIYNVLTENSGTKTLKGILLDMSRIPKLELKAEAFVQMRKLKFLKFYLPYSFERVQVTPKILLPQGLLSLPDELRYLCWEGYPLKTLPTTFDPKNLVELDMSYSHVEQLWEGKQNLLNLKIIRLNYSENLVRIPDLSSSTNLEKIELRGCSNLRELPSSLHHLEKLTHLDFSECKNLRSLPSFYKATTLINLFLHDCSNLSSFPEILETMERLIYLDLSGTALKELPSSIDNLIGLVNLSLNNCKNLVCLPNSFYKLKSLEIFTVQGCSRLEIFPEILETMERLRYLDLSRTGLKELPSSIDNLIGLVNLSLNNCKNLVCLPDSFYKLKSLEIFTIQGCSRLEIFPEILETMERLRYLDLSRTGLKELPSSIDNLIGLVNLSLNNCKNLVCLPDSFYKLKSLGFINLQNCSRLETFPEILETMERLMNLDLSGTPLKELPFLNDNLIGLIHLTLSNCENLVCLPDSFYKLKYLIFFHLQNCSRLEIFPEILETMEWLRVLDLSGTALKKLPSSIDNLICLIDLRLSNCKNLVCLPNNFYKLKTLTFFNLQNCSRLEIFPEILETMEWLRELDLSGTALKELPSSIDNLIGLVKLSLNNCKNLVCLPDSFYKLKSLGFISLQNCSRLETFPEILETMERLRVLDLSGTALKELPSSIDNLIGLEYLSLINCENLVFLPHNLYKLKSLLHVSTCGDSNLAVENMFTTIGGRPVKQKHLHGLSLLWRLDLSESNLENLPTTIKQLPCLEELILRKCKRLKSLPELPPSLVYLDAHDCTTLEDVSSIKKVFEQALFCEDVPNRWLKLIFTNCFQLNEKRTRNDTSVEEVSSIRKLLKQAVFCKSLGWLFNNCFQLDEKAVSSPETPKLEMPFEQLVTVLKDYHQAPPESKKGTRIVTCVPGSEIPEWFDFKSLGSSINIQLPSEWCSNNSRLNFPCFVASVVVSFPDSYNGMEFGIRCKCHLKSCNGDSHYLSCYVSGGFESGLSDHLFLLYGSEEVWGFVKSEASNKRFYNEASFSFYLDLDKRFRSEYKADETMGVKSCFKLSDEALGAILVCLVGSVYPPRLIKVRTLNQHPRPIPNSMR